MMTRVRYFTISSLLAGALLLAACAETAAPDDEEAPLPPEQAAETQGVDENSVKIGFFSVMSGPVNLAGTSNWDGVRLYIDEVNARGGVHGRTIELVGPYDEACEASEAAAAARRLVHDDEVFALLGGGCSGSTLAALPIIEESGIPWVISVSTSPAFFAEPLPNVFRAGTVSDAIQAEAIADAGVQMFETGRPAILAVANEYGQGAADRIESRLKDEYGIDVVANESYELDARDYASQLLRLRQADPDLIFAYSYHQEAGRIVRQARNIGLDVQMLGGSATSTPLFADAAGDAAEGFIALHPVPVLTDSDEDPAMAEYRQLLDDLHDGNVPAGRPSDYDLYGWGAAQALVQGLENAGEELTWGSFLEGLEAIDELDPKLTFPIDFSPTQRDGSRDAMLVRYDREGTREILDYLWSTAHE